MITGDPCIAVHSSRCHLSCDSRNDTPKGEMDKRSVSWVAEVHQCLLYTHHRQTVPIPQWLILKASTMYIHSQWGQWLILKLHVCTFPMSMRLRIYLCAHSQWVWGYVLYMCAHSQWVWGYVYTCVHIPNEYEGSLYIIMSKARLHHYTTRYECATPMEVLIRRPKKHRKGSFHVLVSMSIPSLFSVNTNASTSGHRASVCIYGQSNYIIYCAEQDKFSTVQLKTGWQSGMNGGQALSRSIPSAACTSPHMPRICQM